MPKYILHSEILKTIEKHVKRAGSQNALAKEWDVNVSYISNIRKSKQLPGPKVCQHLGVKAVVVYVADGE